MPTGPYPILDPSHTNGGYWVMSSANRWQWKIGANWYALLYDYIGHVPPWDVVPWPAGDILKSTDNGATWSLCDSGNNPWVPDTAPGLGTANYMAVAVGRIGAKLYPMSTQPLQGPPIDYTGRNILIAEFDTATDSWTSGFSVGSFVMEPVIAWPDASHGQAILTLCNRSNGDMVLFHNGPKDGTGHDRIHYAVWDGSSWGTQTLIASETNKFCYPCGAIEDSNGIIHLFYLTADADNQTVAQSGLALRHLGIGSGYVAGTPQDVITGMNAAQAGWATAMVSYPVIEAGVIHLVANWDYDPSTSFFKCLTYAYANAELNPTFTTEWIDAGSWWSGYAPSAVVGGGIPLALFIGTDRDLWISGAYSTTVHKSHYYRDSSSNVKVIYPCDNTYFTPAPPAGKMRLRFTERVGGVWTEPADYLLLDAPGGEKINCVNCSVEIPVALLQSWGYFGRPSSGYGGGFGQGWGFFG